MSASIRPKGCHRSTANLCIQCIYEDLKLSKKLELDGMQAEGGLQAQQVQGCLYENKLTQ